MGGYVDVRVEGYDVIDCIDKLSWANAYQAFYEPCPNCGRSGISIDENPCSVCKGSGISKTPSEFGFALLEFIRKELWRNRRENS